MVKSSSYQLKGEKLEQNYNSKVKLALDIGTTKICAIISKPDSTNKAIEVLGLGVTASDGMNRGVIVNIDKTVRAIKEAIEKAEQQSGLHAQTAICGIAGDHIHSSQSHHIISISNPQKEIHQEDLDRLIDEASRIPISPDRKILHLFPQEYIIDGQDGVTEPIGMNGVRMEAKIHVVTGLGTAIDNIYKCVERAGLVVEDLILEPYASSYSVLSEDEKEVGVALVDIGGGTTDIAVFHNKVIKFIDVIAMGGNLLTEDVREVLKIVKTEAERIKKEFGHCYLKSLHENTLLQVPGVGGRNPREIKRSELTMILQARMKEIFEFVDQSLINSGYKKNLGSGIVITGGTTLLTGTDELAAEVLQLPVKLGIPSRISSRGLAPEVENPIFATGVGLALHGFRNDLISVEKSKEPEQKTETVHTKIESPIVPKETKKAEPEIIEEYKEEKEKVSKEGIITKIKKFFEKLFENF